MRKIAPNQSVKSAKSDNTRVKGSADFKPSWPWSPPSAVLVVILLYLSQIAVQAIILLYPLSQHWSHDRISNWFSSSPVAGLVFTVLAEGVVLLLLWWFIRARKVSFKDLGWNRWPKWTDVALALIGLVVFMVASALILGILGYFVPVLNSNQPQQLGFDGAAGFWPLAAGFISLVLLPPFVEETMFRGFLLGSLRKKLSFASSAVWVSVFFGLAHLEVGSGAPLLWAAAVQMFLLSLVFCYIRVKSGSLWASTMMHFSKNLIAFLLLFVFSQALL